jgi:YD repeat-containing protein
VLGSIERWEVDVEGLPRKHRVQSERDPDQFVDETFDYDKSGHLTRIESGLLTQTRNVNVFGMCLK